MFRVTRQARTIVRQQTRNYSQKPSEDAVKKAQETAAEYAKKGQEFASNLLKNSGGAGEYAKKGSEVAAKYAQSARSAVGPLADRGFALVPSLKPTLLTASAFARIVYRAEGLAPPLNIDVWRNAFAELTAIGRNTFTSRGHFSFSTLLGSLNTRAVARTAVIGAEAYGIYKVGEIIGRRQLVGYDVE
ncbi:hypothetical protein CYLTODRAFT_425729 [Cylindrobasidium torrendii FP15055 ss-10]|uniref:Mitochondrial F1F0-ATP synthase g subunit n=1 Tax=Cylindrobasidium torrendii FP15055 ss-10 TaxID=1314674 RepID=A0A0D7B0A7_9AGAR|nr:hypothetical protein CYLTODRAFT_425729 [Cylindrobasidium torrendii FP15055 ss-10]